MTTQASKRKQDDADTRAGSGSLSPNPWWTLHAATLDIVTRVDLPELLEAIVKQ